jgi:protein-tyrosine phosphatase
MTEPIRLTFVCMGNICRSPTAHGVMRHKVRAAGLAGRIHVDSAGTHAWHTQDPPDARSQRHALQRGYDLSDLRARTLLQSDFARSELVLVMDHDNVEHAGELCPDVHRHKLRRLTEFCRVHRSDIVPDPYYGGAADFERVLDLVEDACDGLLEDLRRRLGAA